MSGELPEGWKAASLTNLVENHDGRRVPVKAADRALRKGAYPYYGASGIIDQVDGYLFDGEYLLIAEDGANLLSRSTSIAFKADGQFWVNNHAHIVRPRGGISLGYIEHFLNATDLAPFVTGSAQPKLTQRALDSIVVPVPPSTEQHRIVEKIDSLFARSTRARDELAHIPRLIERYRQAVLEAAFRGDLTADWRKANGLAATVTEQTVDMLVMEPIRNGLSVRGSDDPPGIPALRLSALRQDKVNLSDCRYLPITTDKASRYLLREGDVLISRGNGTKSFVARSSLVPAVDAPIIFPDTAFRVRLNPQVADAEWFSMLWNAPQVRDQIENLAKTTAGIWKVSQGDLIAVKLRVPSVAEQIEIIRRIKMAFTALGTIDAEVRRGSSQLARLDASILDKAFAGELVPQDPADEPASVLLKRIQATRADAPAKKRGRKAKG